jgi:aspartate racemase
MRNKGERVIGVVGGVGPYAGLDLCRKVFGSTRASCDQDHADLLLASCPSLIPDRTAYLLGGGGENPAIGILRCMGFLYEGGARVFGVPCNTAHSAPVWSEVERGFAARFADATLVNMVSETAKEARALCGGGAAGLLATKGTHHSGVYKERLEAEGLSVLEPDAKGIDAVMAAIYDPEWGIKARSDPPTQRAIRVLASAALSLRDHGARAVIMGCTEIPLALDGAGLDIPLIDAGLCLARALLREAAPGRLKA